MALVRYPENSNTKLYLCRDCRTHIALHEQLLSEEDQHAIFRNLVNVAEQYDAVTRQTRVACIKCCTYLGMGTNSAVKPHALGTGRYDIAMTNLLFWNGSEIVYAGTEQPVDNYTKDLEITKSTARYEKSPWTKFYLCRYCDTHIALHEEMVVECLKLENVVREDQHAVFRALVNVAEKYDDSTAQCQVSCSNCGMNLGIRLLSVQPETSVMRDGRYLINMKHLFFWDGREILCVSTGQPAQDAWQGPKLPVQPLAQLPEPPAQDAFKWPSPPSPEAWKWPEPPAPDAWLWPEYPPNS